MNRRLLPLTCWQSSLPGWQALAGRHSLGEDDQRLHAAEENGRRVIM